ncbi:MAG TPA: sulfatase-like hydrolase/transferase [Phycisphaerae bacterium]|nr:sulfatase-like hydrolase/transferase [Phycisphaerae bacterium]
MSRPNVLLIHADQHRFDCVAANPGAPAVLRTPNLDRLAAGGINFRHAFCPVPLCVSSRCSLLTGTWATRHGALVNFGVEGSRPMDPKLPTFSGALAEAGYHLGYVGQWHADPARRPEDFGFHEYVPDRLYDEWRAAQGLPPRPRTNRWFGEADPHVAPEQSRLGWGTSEVIRMLRRRAGGGKPFFLRWDPVEPHLPNVVPEPFASMYAPQQVPPWPGFADDLAGKPYIQAQQRRTWGLDGWAWDRWAPLVARYLGEVSLLDAQVGRLLDALDELHLADSTLVVYAADHGDLCGSHGMIDKHFVMYDDVVRVPMIARWPGRIAAGTTCDAFVSAQLDLAWTFCELAGAPVPETFQGRSLLPAFDGTDADPRQDIFATYHGSQFGLYSQRMVRDRRWKYVWNATAEDELYDLAADPGELGNLAASPAHAEALARLRKRLVEWMDQTADPLLNAWTRAQLLEGNTR